MTSFVWMSRNAYHSVNWNRKNNNNFNFLIEANHWEDGVAQVHFVIGNAWILIFTKKKKKTIHFTRFIQFHILKYVTLKINEPSRRRFPHKC